MTTHAIDPFTVRTFVILRPDRLIRETEQGPDGPLDLAELFSEPGPYNAVRLARGAEMHHHPASTYEPNDIAAALAELFGYDPMDIRGTVHFTGNSGEADSAPGMDDDAYAGLLDALAQICNDRGARLWRQYRPSGTVMVRPTDYAPGDTFWAFGTPHRFRGLVDYPADSKTAQMFPGVQYVQCDDGFEMTASGSVYPTRADRAPAGYWQRTGNQLLPDD
ncbi:hypothetical protein [Streptomyces sp. V1I6]|uniref:hypothetical protein n=1 Tax=Streptomyces sp. V1I6 TaxID=3042273 RepID=UPI002789F0EC|nr:hypothetical protein [Streptomyces sp. V1I6]MDQ0847776.1 hypothetical protein [Streptomyces sp. V1I6]